MGMRFSLNPWPRKRGDPALEVVVSPGNGPSEPSGRKELVKEGGDGSMSEVGVKYVGRRGSVWERREHL